MKLVRNTGSDRVIDEVRKSLVPPSSFDLASSEFSLFAYAELRDLLENLAEHIAVAEVEPLAMGMPA